MLRLKARYTLQDAKKDIISTSRSSSTHSQGKCIILTFDEDIGSALRKACNIDDDAMHLACAAQRNV